LGLNSWKPNAEVGKVHPKAMPVILSTAARTRCLAARTSEGAASGWLAEALDHPLDGMSQPVTIAASEMPGSFQREVSTLDPTRIERTGLVSSEKRHAKADSLFP
jgi:hypothetical protein